MANSEKTSRQNSMSASVRKKKKAFLVIHPSFSPKTLLLYRVGTCQPWKGEQVHPKIECWALTVDLYDVDFYDVHVFLSNYEPLLWVSLGIQTSPAASELWHWLLWFECGVGNRSTLVGLVGQQSAWFVWLPSRSTVNIRQKSSCDLSPKQNNGTLSPGLGGQRDREQHIKMGPCLTFMISQGTW